MVTVEHENTKVKGDESAGRLALVFRLVASELPEEPFTVQVCLRELNETGGSPVSDISATG